jgi:phosphotransferase system enzyme I (PtsI)
MQILQGIAVSPGVAIGEALVIDREGFRIPRRFVARNAVEHELQRWRSASAAVADEISRSRQHVATQLGDRYAGIFSAQRQMLGDPKLVEEIESLIRGRHYSSEFAVSQTLRGYAGVLQGLESQLIAQRANDVFDIEKRLLQELTGQRHEVLSNLSQPAIILAHNLTPSEAAHLDSNFVLGFVSEIGGPGGHTAIVAEALEIPAVVGTGAFLSNVTGGDVVIIDGESGQVIVQPDDETLERYRQQAENERTLASHLATLAELPGQTLDGVTIQLMANIEFPREAEASASHACDGIGLYRTEFLYLGSDHEPSEEEHFRAYARVIEAMDERPVVIRTLDLGADKMGSVRGGEEERNPFLGLRSIRHSLRNLPLFRTQLRAIMRASVLGDVRVMFPLISTVQELRRAKSLLADIVEDLEEEGIAVRGDIPIGMMVEVPSSVLLLDRFAKEVDFFSIGTNDLTQYALAVDRSNKEVASLYNSCDPAVLKLLKMALDGAERNGVPVSVCGQMSGSPRYTMLLLGLGLRCLSVPPNAIAEVKNVCRAVTLNDCRRVAEKAMSMDDATEIKAFLKSELRKAVPPLTPERIPT